MHAALLMATFALAAPDRPNPRPMDPPKTLHEQILGDWRLDRLAVGGGLPDQPMKTEDRVIQINRTEILVLVNGQLRQEDGTNYKIDVKANPVTIDITPKNGATATMHGILKLEGEQLVICFSIGGARPTQFATNPNDITALMYLKRVKR
jgi:uncharacterized protein (TIGR03067 family)